MLSSKYKEIIDKEFAGEDIDIDNTHFPPLPHNRGGKNPRIINKNIIKCPIHGVLLREGSACPLCEDRNNLDLIPEHVKGATKKGGRKSKYTLEEKKERQREASKKWRDNNRQKALDSQRAIRRRERFRKGYHYLDTIGLRNK